MNLNWLALGSVVVGLAVPARAALQFTTNVHSGGASLTAAAYNDTDTFVAVGAGSTVLVGRYGTSLELSDASVGGNVSLRSAAFGAGSFLAGGPNAAVFSSADGSTWLQRSNAFPNAASVQAVAYNPGSGGRFIAAGSIFEIAYAGPSLNWASAQLVSAHFLESFKGATPMGVDAFAACGILGAVRISSDGGQIWNVSRPLNTHQRDLFGIASDGAQKLVAVGAVGTILVSVDGGATWTTNASNVTSDLNAVAYSGAEFVAVGNNGTILTSPDGNTWANATVGGADLNGIVFATKGNLQGVGFLVGDNGTVLLAGTAPAAPLTNSLSSKTNCTDNLTNPALEVTVVSDSTHPAGTVTVDWYDGQGNLRQPDSMTFPPPDTQAPANAPAEYTYYAEARDRRTGLTSATRVPVTLTLYPRPKATVTGTATICNGGTTIVQAELTGVPPWTVTWASNGIPIETHPGIMVPNVSLSVSPPNTGLTPKDTVYNVSVLSDFFNCGAFGSNLTTAATITVIPTPTVVQPDVPPVCNGAEVAVVFSGNATSFTWINDNTSIGLPASGINNIASFPATNTGPVAAVATVTVTPHYSANGVDCEGTARTFTIKVSPTPTVVQPDVPPVCNNGPVTVNFTGNATSFTWVNNNTSFGLPSSGTNNISLLHAVNNGLVAEVATVTVTPRYFTNGLECAGSPATFSIKVSPEPTVVQPANQTVCNGGPVTAVNFTGNATSYTWVNSDTSIGLAAAGTNDIGSFTAVNLGPTSVVASITVTPQYFDAGKECPGASATFTITVNPTPTVAQPTDQTVSNGGSVTAVNFTGNATSYTWVNSDSSIGLAAAGTNAIASFTAVNTGPSPVVANITVTPQYFYAGKECPGSPATFKITVIPTPTVGQPGDQTVCNGGTVAAVHFTGFATSYTWTNDHASIGLAEVGTNDIASFTALNPGPTPVVATIAVTPYYATNGLNFPGTPTTFTITVHALPTAVLSGDTNVCNNAAVTTVAELTGEGPWTVTWEVTGAGKPIAPVTYTNVTSPLTNVTDLSGVNGQKTITVAITSLIDSADCAATDLSGSKIEIKLANPMVPLSDGNITSCLGLTFPPLSVTVTNGEHVDWFSAMNLGILLRSNSISFTPTNAVEGTNRYYAEAYFEGGCVSARREVWLILQPCTNQLSISLENTNAVVQWYGNYVLQSATSPFFWPSNVLAIGLGGTNNYWTNPVTPPEPPVNFFRLYAPTN
ncbi:MAG TPA: PKD-like domain-containing protein [Verrucomicrobiae bacterium]